jgi:hypothetical protein
MNVVEIVYALAKQIPAMRREVQLYTEHGEMLLQGRDAERVAKLVERLLYAKLRQLEREARRGRRIRCEEPRECYRTDDLMKVDRRIACGRAFYGQGMIASPGVAVTGRENESVSALLRSALACSSGGKSPAAI